MKPQVDRHLEQIYLNILIDKLQKPEEWKKTDNNNTNGKYNSTYIEGTRTLFRTAGTDSDGDFRAEKVSIRTGEYITEIHELPIRKWRIRRMLRKLHEYMIMKDEWSKYESIDNQLKRALPENIDRYLKLTKIKKKL